MSRSASKLRKGVGAAALLAAALLLYPQQALTVLPARGPGLLWAVPARAKDQFTLSWTHTVTLRPITETYAVEPDGRIRLLEMTFDQYGPNLPAGPEEGTQWRIERDRWVVTGYSIVQERLNLGVGPYGHQVRLGRVQWDMLKGAGPDRLVRLEVRRWPMILILLTEGWQWRNTSRF